MCAQWSSRIHHERGDPKKVRVFRSGVRLSACAARRGAARRVRDFVGESRGFLRISRDTSAKLAAARNGGASPCARAREIFFKHQTEDQTVTWAARRVALSRKFKSREKTEYKRVVACCLLVADNRPCDPPFVIRGYRPRGRSRTSSGEKG